MTNKKTFKFDEVIKAASQYFQNNDLAADIWAKKYALRDGQGEYHELTPEDMHHRIAGEFARIEAKYSSPMTEEEIFALLKDFRYFVPAGSPMFGIGNSFQTTSLSNCFAITTVDSYGGICQSDERIAQVSKRRGGIGLDISPIRPRGMPTKNAAHTTDGIVVFMKRFANTSKEVAQHGRRGALMLSCSVHHPEIVNFIQSKAELQAITGANISVRISDAFMQAVKNDSDYELCWPVDSDKPKFKKQIKAKEVWDELVKHAFLHAEPGVLFWDTIIRNSPADCYSDLSFNTVSTNPCGELPLSPFGSCIISALNLTGYVKSPFTTEASFDQELFFKHAQMGMRLLDDLVDLEIESIEKIIAKVESDPEHPSVKANELELWRSVRQVCINGRRTGLGITALGDAVAMMGMKYGDEASVEFVKNVYSILRNGSYASSVNLAKERGSFPIYDASREVDHAFLSKLPDEIKEAMKIHGRRNIACMTTAPVGTTSNVALVMDHPKTGRIFGTSSGFEPVFMHSYVRRKKMSINDKGEPDSMGVDGEKYKHFEVLHPGLTAFCTITKKKPSESPYEGAQAGEISYEARVKMQAVATSFVDHSISSTVNLKKDVDISVVADVYMQAWEHGCKGITVYRDGSREGILVSKTGIAGCDNCDEAAEKFKQLVKQGGRPGRVIMSSAPKRPDVLPCDIVRATVKGKQWVFLIGLLHGQPYEFFGGANDDLEIPKKFKTGWILKDGKHGDRTMYDLILGSLENDGKQTRLVINNVAKVFGAYEHATFSRVVSLALRHGIPIKYLCEQLTKDPEDDFQSYNRALARVLKSYIEEGEQSGLECPNCHAAKMIYKGGCPSCMVCGNSSCS